MFILAVFIEEKGIEFILKLSKLLPNINFYLYGDISTLNKQNLLSIPKNVFFRRTMLLTTRSLLFYHDLR